LGFGASGFAALGFAALAFAAFCFATVAFGLALAGLGAFGGEASRFDLAGSDAAAGFGTRFRCVPGEGFLGSLSRSASRARPIRARS
jgi:hypothetical protein